MKNIWISGSINSGKTTVSKILGKELKMAVIELDSFSEFVLNFMDFEEYVKLNYDIFPEVVEMYNKRGLGVIIVYPLSEERYAVTWTPNLVHSSCIIQKYKIYGKTRTQDCTRCEGTNTTQN